MVIRLACIIGALLSQARRTRRFGRSARGGEENNPLACSSNQSEYRIRFNFPICGGGLVNRIITQDY